MASHLIKRIARELSGNKIQELFQELTLNSVNVKIAEYGVGPLNEEQLTELLLQISKERDELLKKGMQ